MNKNTITIIVVALIALAGLFFFLQNKNTPSLSLISPNGGEVLEIGTIHTIKWKSKNISDENLISISIRRVMPTSEQIEGQEFDPVIFVNLPNTGSVDWMVSDMYPSGEYLINITSYSSLPITDSIGDESNASFQIVNSLNEVNWETYYNETLGYSINYPNSLTLREFPDTKTGAGFHNEASFECITIAARESTSTLPFDQYVKVAAIEEIQGFKTLNSLEEITTKSGFHGYKTTWEYVSLSGENKISLPITYFEGSSSDFKTIQINLNDSNCEEVYNEMLYTFNK